MIIIEDIKNIRGGDMIITGKGGRLIKALGRSYVASDEWLEARGGHTRHGFKLTDVVYLIKAEHINGAYKGCVTDKYFLSRNDNIKVSSIEKGLGIFVGMGKFKHEMV
jgi:hypothetical protein